MTTEEQNKLNAERKRVMVECVPGYPDVPPDAVMDALPAMWDALLKNDLVCGEFTLHDFCTAAMSHYKTCCLALDMESFAA